MVVRLHDSGSDAPDAVLKVASGPPPLRENVPRVVGRLARNLPGNPDRYPAGNLLRSLTGTPVRSLPDCRTRC